MFVLVSFENDVVGNLEFSWSIPKNYPAEIWSGIEIVGTRGAAYTDVHDQGLRLFTNSLRLPDTLHWPEYNEQIYGDLRSELMHFFDATVNNKEFLMPTEDSIKAVGFVEAWLKSIEKDVPIKVG